MFDPASTGVGAYPGVFRIVDQSVAVLSQYAHGKDRYRRYMHLHTAAELAEAEFRFQHDETLFVPPTGHMMYGESRPGSSLSDDPSGRSPRILPSQNTQNVQNVQSVPFGMGFGVSSTLGSNSGFSVPVAADVAMASPSGLSVAGLSVPDDVILESYDITNILMHPTASHAQSNAGLSTPFIAAANLPVSDFPVASVDPDALVQLILRHRYYWVLDLFNDMAIWRTMIPAYCVRHAHARPTQPLLIQCLMQCRPQTSMSAVAANVQAQLHAWHAVECGDGDPEHVLISVVLILLSAFLHCTQPSFEVCSAFSMVVASQGRLIRRMALHFPKTRKHSVLTAAAFHAIMILRFLLRKHLETARHVINDTNPHTELLHEKLRHRRPSQNDAMGTALRIDRDASSNVAGNIGGDIGGGIMDDFFIIGPFEQAHLTSHFRNLEISASQNSSDAAQLRSLFWAVVEHDYYGMLFHAPSPALAEDSTVAAVRPSDACVAYTILAAYSHRLQGGGDTALREIFHRIETSAMSRDTRAKWAAYFRWTVDVCVIPR